MSNINGIRIAGPDCDRVCLNCIHWQADIQLRGAANGMLCTRGQGHTNPTDSCSQFMPNYGGDSVQDPNGYNEKRNRMDVWRM